MKYRVIAYLRCSTGSQSVERQREIAKDYCSLKGYELINTIEENVSGAKANRKSIADLLSLTSEDCDEVCFSELSRLTREHFTKVFGYMTTLKENGINIHFIDKNRTYKADEEFDLVDFIVLAVEAHGAQQELDKIKTRLKSGKDTKMKHHPYMFIGGLPPFGYDVIDNPNYEKGEPKRIIVKNEEKMIAVKRCFELACEGKSCQKIADYLNNCGYCHNLGKKWLTDEILKNIIKNPLYIGQRKLGNVIHQVEQIIPTEVFYKANEAVHNRWSTKAKRDDYFNPLKGLLFCGHCGLKMGVRSEAEKGAFYKCLYNNYKRRLPQLKECHNAQIKVEYLTEKVEFMLKQMKDISIKHNKSLVTPNSIQVEIKKMVRTYQELDEAFDKKHKEVELMEEQLRALPVDTPDILLVTVADKVNELRQQRLDIQKQQNKIQDTINELKEQRKQIIEAREIPTTDNDKAVYFRSVIDHITWEGKYRKAEGTIKMYLKDGTVAELTMNAYTNELIEWTNPLA